MLLKVTYNTMVTALGLGTGQHITVADSLALCSGPQFLTCRMVQQWCTHHTAGTSPEQKEACMSVFGTGKSPSMRTVFKALPTIAYIITKSVGTKNSKSN